MIRITYAPADQELARRISHDLSAQAARAQPLLIALASESALAEPSVQAEIAQAQRQKTPILPILTDSVALPPALAKLQPLDFRAGYDREQLLSHASKLAGTRRDIKRANRRALVAFLCLVALMFGLAIAGMAGGLVAFPVDEYNEEATFQAQWIDGLIRETLEFVQPRSTEDALNFAATYEAAPTRLHFYVRGTATASARLPET